MSDHITHASDGTPGIEREHPDETGSGTVLDGMFDAPCEGCGEQWEIIYQRALLCLGCADERAADRKVNARIEID